MNDDARFAHGLGRLVDDPTPEFRAALRERLVDESTGRTTVPIEVGSPDAQRRDRRPGWLVVGAVAAAAALMVSGLVMVTRRDDPSPADQPDVFAALTAIAHGRLLEVRVTTSKIVADPGRDLVATLRIDTADAATGVVELSGDDTCHRYGGTVTVDASGRVTSAALESEGEACDDSSVVPTAGDVLRPIDGGVEIVTRDEVHRFVAFEALERYDPSAAGWDGSYAAGAAERPRLLEIAPGPAIAFGPCVADVQFGDDGFLSAREDVTCSTDGVYGLLLDALLGGSLRFARSDGFLYADTTELTVLLRPAGGISDEFQAPAPDDLTGHLWIDPDLGLGRVPMLSIEATDVEGMYAVEQFDGCNQGSGTVTFDGGDVVASEIASTKIGCAFDQPTRLAPGAVVGIDVDSLGRLRLLVSDGGVTTSYVALDSLPAALTADDMRNTWWHPGTGAITFAPTGRADAGGLAVGIGGCDTSGTIEDGYLTTSEPIDATCAVVPEAEPDLVGRLAHGTSRWYRYGTFLLMESERGVDLFDVYSTLVTPPDDDSTVAPTRLPTGCDQPLPDQLDDVGASHTIVPAANSDAFTVTFETLPTQVCPTGSFATMLTVTNITSAAATFDSFGLMITAGSAAKWTVAPIPAIDVPAGAAITIGVTATIPDALQPGTYRLFAYGYDGDTTITIATPTSG